MSSLRLALAEAITEAGDRIQLADKFRALEEVTAMDTPALRSAKAMHDAEIVMLKGRIEISAHARWAQSARRALQILRTHRNWIADELRRRDKAEALKNQREARIAAAASRAENIRRQQENYREIHQARIERIHAANNETAKATALFKEVAREVLGMEMYEHLWELTRMRLESVTDGAPEVKA